jgi:hypothetical protein
MDRRRQLLLAAATEIMMMQRDQQWLSLLAMKQLKSAGAVFDLFLLVIKFVFSKCIFFSQKFPYVIGIYTVSGKSME